MTAFVAGCGGGGGGGGDGSTTATSASSPAAGETDITVSTVSTQATRAKLPVLSLAFTAPADQEVLNVGTAAAVTVRLKIDGAAAIDGTVVRFGGPSAQWLPVLPTTSAGLATTAFTATAPGRQEITATVQAGGQTVSAVRTVYARPTPAPLEILVPAYFSASDTTHWATMTAGAAAHPTLAVTAIMNPNNGIFTTADPDYLRALAQFAAVGGRTVGYVYTGYGTGSRSLDAVKANIDQYLALYGRTLIGGFFLDEMASDPERLAFYQEIYRYIKARDPSPKVIGNPGTVPDAVYAGVADTLVTFEDRGTAYTRYDPRQGNAWLYLQANSRQAALVYGENCAAMQRAVAAAATARFNAGPVYMTNLKFNPKTGVGDPWKALPAYWTQLLETVSAVNRGVAPTAC
ncbi:spherulation-specific family 4 protein [Xylophilus ampelinus]|nr:spherulation-specific family 4 protein [Xylophilus ampelinus]MCS4510130.1 spherulation-specific family 4 protein [Xylophilus ampelinus]